MLAGRIALVTGATSGIGYQVSKIFAQHGANLIMADINNNFDELLKDINSLENQKNKKHLTCVCDVSKSDDVKNLFKSIKTTYPDEIPSVIVNSAGVAKSVPFIDLSEDEFNRVLDINLKGTFLVTQAAVKELLNNYKNVKLNPQDTYASIINIGSVIGKFGYPAQASYAASKAGIEGFTKSVAREVGKYQIRCNTILPGFIETPMTQSIPKALKDSINARTALLRVGEPQEVAAVCLFLASNMSSYVTGASIDINGGLNL